MFAKCINAIVLPTFSAIVTSQWIADEILRYTSMKETRKKDCSAKSHKGTILHVMNQWGLQQNFARAVTHLH